MDNLLFYSMDHLDVQNMDLYSDQLLKVEFDVI